MRVGSINFGLVQRAACACAHPQEMCMTDLSHGKVQVVCKYSAVQCVSTYLQLGFGNSLL